MRFTVLYKIPQMVNPEKALETDVLAAWPIAQSMTAECPIYWHCAGHGRSTGE